MNIFVKAIKEWALSHKLKNMREESHVMISDWSLTPGQIAKLFEKSKDNVLFDAMIIKRGLELLPDVAARDCRSSEWYENRDDNYRDLITTMWHKAQKNNVLTTVFLENANKVYPKVAQTFEPAGSHLSWAMNDANKVIGRLTFQPAQ